MLLSRSTRRVDYLQGNRPSAAARAFAAAL